MENDYYNDNDNQYDDEDLSTGMTMLSYCIPIVGAAIFFVNKEDYPEKAKVGCHAAVWGLLAFVAIVALLTVLLGS